MNTHLCHVKGPSGDKNLIPEGRVDSGGPGVQQQKLLTDRNRIRSTAAAFTVALPWCGGQGTQSAGSKQLDSKCRFAVFYHCGLHLGKCGRFSSGEVAHMKRGSEA